MNDKEYMVERVDDQINWLEGKAASFKRKFMRIRTLELVCSALIPFLVAMIPGAEGGNGWFFLFKWVTGGLGVVITILAGIQTLNKYQELWSQYRAVAESLKSEKLMYLTRAGHYSSAADAFQLFVINVEAILARENEKWQRHIEKIAPVAKSGTL